MAGSSSPSSIIGTSDIPGATIARPFRKAFSTILHGGLGKGGDFDWNVAFHPYPENLFNPRTWNDACDTRLAEHGPNHLPEPRQLIAYLQQPEPFWRKGAAGHPERAGVPYA